MQALTRWIVWKLEDRGGKKPTKTPYCIRGGYAKVNDPSTWATFSEAVKAVKDGYSGIGFVFTGTPYVGIDVDGCIDPATKAITPEASEIVEKLDSYTELSPSETGFHVITKGKLPEGRRRKGPYEMYGDGSARYFTMTGDIYGFASPVRECQAEINQIHSKYIADTVSGHEIPWDGVIDASAYTGEKSDDQFLEDGLKRDRKLISLYNGDRPSGDESADDLSLLNKLAYWCNGNAALMERAFFRSPYHQQKDEKHKKKCARKDYLPGTIKEALADLRSTAREDHEQWRQEQVVKDFNGSVPKAPATGPALIKASAVPYEPPRWSIKPYFQRGKGTLVQADNGVGKTAFMCAVAAHVSTGESIIDNTIEAPGDVLILSVEDDLPVLRGRIEASGGNLDRCHFMTNAAGLTFNSPEIEQAVKQIHAKMIIFDPFQAFLGANINMDKSNQTRPELAKLFEMADRNDCAVVIIAHTGKGSGLSSAVNRSLGSVDIPAAMRSIIQIVRNPEINDECVAIHIKCSNAEKGKSIAYNIGDRGGVRWNGYSTMTVEDLDTIVKRKEKGVPYDREPLVKVFNQLIADRPGGGFWSYGDLKESGMKILGFPPFSTNNDLKFKLDASLSKELQENDGLIVTHSQRGGKGVRGIRIEQYEHPEMYQTSLPTKTG